VACKQRWARWSRCGQAGRVRGGTKTEPLCATCTRPEAGFWTSYPACGETGRIHAGRCARCTLDRRLHELLGDEAGEIRPRLRRVLDTEARWEQARRLLHDTSLDPEDRVAGLLVLLYAQWSAVISRLTLGHVHAGGEQVRLRLGREPVTLPGSLADLVRQLLATRRGHAAIGDDGTSTWLFPGGQPARPISSYRLAERLRELGIYSGQAAPPRCSSSPPTCPPPSWPACLASTSPSPSPGSGPPPETGPPTPQRSAAQRNRK
jgi:hypothetical protein